MVEQLFLGDILALVGYFILVLGVGIWSAFRPNRDSAKGYFLAGKSMHWFPVGASLFASNIGAPMFIGLAGAAAANGFSVVVYEWHAIYLLIALGWLFVPVYVSSGSFTMPEYLRKRFGGHRLRIYLSVLALFLYVLTRISSEIYTGALFLQLLMGWNLYYCICGILVVTALYTMIGGLTAVIYTDTLQAVVLLMGAVAVTSFMLYGARFSQNLASGFAKIGGFAALRELYPTASANLTNWNLNVSSCGLPRSDAFQIWRDPLTGDIPWPGALTGLTILGLWVWCSDQIIVQRSLSARNMAHAKGASLFAAALKIAPFFLWIIPGMISRILYPDEVACATPESCYKVCQNRAGCSNIAYPLLVLRILPEGVKGLMLAGVLSAQMSTLTSIFSSASSMFTMDIWPYVRKQPSQNELMLVGRITVLVLTGFGILWLPILQQSQGGQMWAYLQAIAAFTAPPWTMVFLFGIFWKRTTEQAAFWGLMVGLATGLPRLCLEFIFPAPFCGSGDEDTRPAILKDVHFLYFAVILSAVVSLVIVVVSLLTEPRSPEKLRRVTWWTRHEEDPQLSDDDDDDDVADDKDEVGNCIAEVKAKIDNGEQLETTDVTFRQPEQKERSFFRKLLYWICGFHKEHRVKPSRADRKLIQRELTDVTESSRAKLWLNMGAILLCMFTAFLLGFFHS